MAERTLAHEKIEAIWDSAVEEILPGDDGKVQAIRVKNLNDGTTSEVFCKGVFYRYWPSP